MSAARFTLGPRLKAHRERHGISLRQIAHVTKIGVPLLVGLERNDVDRWPRGIYRRAFLKSYTEAIGVPFAATWVEFCRLFPEDGSPPILADVEQTDLRLTFPRSRHPLWPTRTNLLAALLDLGVVLTCGVAAGLLGPWSVGTCIAVVAASYSTLATLFTGGSVARRFVRVRVAPPLPVDMRAAPTQPSLEPLLRADNAPRLALAFDPMPAHPPVPRPRIVSSRSSHIGTEGGTRRHRREIDDRAV